MKPQIRIIKSDSKYFVEYLAKRSTFFSKAVWKPYVTWSGLKEAYPHKTYDSAMDNLIQEVKRISYVHYLEL